MIDMCINGSTVYCAGGGSGGRAFAFSLANGNLLWYYQTDGNCQAVTTLGGYPIFGYHGDNVAKAPNTAMGGGNIARGKIFMCDPATGALQSWNPSMGSNTNLKLGVWALTTGDGNKLYAGGDFTKVSQVNQQRFAIFLLNSGNHAPTWNSNPFTKPNATQDSPYTGVSLAGDATDPDAGDTLTFSKRGGPSWLSVAGNGDLSGTPGSGDIGANVFTVRVTDAGSLFSEATMNVTVVSSQGQT